MAHRKPVTEGTALAPVLTGIFKGTTPEYERYLADLREQTKGNSEFAAKMARIAAASMPAGESRKKEESPKSLEPQRTSTLPDYIEQDHDFMAAVNSVAAELGTKPDYLLDAMAFETAGTFDPAIKAPTSSATGLIQFLESTAEGLGTSTAELATMNRTQQMKYVADYLRPFAGRLHDYGSVYMAIHYPKAVGKEDSYGLYMRGSKAYTANKGLDTDGDGVVTKGEAVRRAER